MRAVQEWLGDRGLDVSRRGIRAGRFMLLADSDQLARGPGGPKHLYLLDRDFKGVLVMVRWPERWWPK